MNPPPAPIARRMAGLSLICVAAPKHALLNRVLLTPDEARRLQAELAALLAVGTQLDTPTSPQTTLSHPTPAESAAPASSSIA